MKHLLKINADSEAVFKDHDVVYYAQNSGKSYVMKHYDNPFIKIFMSDSYHDTSIIPLIAKKYGNISGDITWSHDLGDKATIEDGVIRFLQHYTGTITVTATAGGKSDSHTATIDCEEIPTSYTYSILNVSKPTATWDDTSAEISFTYRVAENYPLKPSAITDTTQKVTVNFPKNSHTFNYSTSNKYVDLGLSTGLKWAACSIGTQNENENGLFFQWGDVDGYSGYADPDVKRTGTFDFESVENTPWEVTQNGFQKVFDWANYKYCNGTSTSLTKYNNSESYGTVDNNTELKDADDAAIQNLRSQPGHENARMPKTGEYQTLKDETMWVWSPGGKVGVKKTGENGTETIDYVDYPAGYFVFKTISDKGATGTFSKDGTTGNLNSFTSTNGIVYYPGAHEITEGDVTRIVDGDTHIFFPCSGFASGTGVNFRGSGSDYWSSSLYTSSPNFGRNLDFNSGLVFPQSSDYRFCGFCVRSVSEN